MKKDIKYKRTGDEHTKKIMHRVIQVLYRTMERNPDVRSRKAFAARIFTTPQTIYKWEHGTGQPTLEQLGDICTQFGISGDWLLKGDGKMHGDIELTIRVEMLEKRMDIIEYKTGIHTSGKKKKSA